MESSWVRHHQVKNCCFFPPDVLFEEDDRVMPLMSAAKIWSRLKETVEDECLFNNIMILLLVQVTLANIWGVYIFTYLMFFNKMQE